MAYNVPETALHHLNMATSYIEEAQKIGQKEKEPKQSISDAEIQLLSQAAQHLNMARTIDPDEVLWVTDEKEKIKYKVDQDRLNAKVLLLEGVAHLNAALDISTFSGVDHASRRDRYDRGMTRLGQARAALEKALTYQPIYDDAFEKLATTYRHFGDRENYRRVLERHVEVSPEKIQLHRQMEVLNQGQALPPLFKEPPFNILGLITVILWLCIPAGCTLGVIGGSQNISWLGGLGAIMFIGSIAVLFLKWRF